MIAGQSRIPDCGGAAVPAGTVLSHPWHASNAVRVAFSASGIKHTISCSQSGLHQWTRKTVTYLKDLARRSAF